MKSDAAYFNRRAHLVNANDPRPDMMSHTCTHSALQRIVRALLIGIGETHRSSTICGQH